MKIIWLRSARANLSQIRSYIAQSDPGNARVVLSRIVRSVETLERFPRRGRSGHDPETRELIVPRTPYIVVYRVGDDAVEILRVFHGAQRWPSL